MCTTVNPLYTNIWYNAKTCYNNIRMEWIFSSRWNGLLEKLNYIVFNIPRNTCHGYLLESPRRGDSNRYPKHMFLRVNKERKGFLSLIIVLYFAILYICKFFLTAESLGTNAVVITRFFFIFTWNFHTHECWNVFAFFQYLCLVLQLGFPWVLFARCRNSILQTVFDILWRIPANPDNVHSARIHRKISSLFSERVLCYPSVLPESKIAISCGLEPYNWGGWCRGYQAVACQYTGNFFLCVLSVCLSDKLLVLFP